MARRTDPIGLGAAMADRLLPGLAAAVTLLAALALGAAFAAATLAERWHGAASEAVTVQVPAPAGKLPTGASRIEAALRLVRATPGVDEATQMQDGRLAELLRPWLGPAAEQLALPLPAIIEVRPHDDDWDPASLRAQLAEAVPGTSVETQGRLVTRLRALARGVQALGAVAVLIATGIAACVVVMATRATLSARRDAVEILHLLGADDRQIANRFARRAAARVAAGALLGTAVGGAVLVGLAGIAGPVLPVNPVRMSVALPLLPVAAAAIGWGTAQLAVRSWLRRLP